MARTAARTRSRRRNRGMTAALALGGLLIVVWSLAPLYWGLVVSLSTPLGLKSVPPALIPHPATTTYYAQLLNGHDEASVHYLMALRNSVIEATATTLLTITFAFTAAYAFARWRFHLSSLLFYIILGTLSLPVYAVLIPLFQFAVQTGTVGSFSSVILILTSSTLPLAVWILRSHIASLPPDIENAARLDGASSLTVFWRIVMPLSRPGVAAAAVIVFLGTWSNFLIPLTFAPTDRTKPITVLIPEFASRYSQNYGLQATAGIIALLPPVLVVLWLNRYLLSGLLRGALNH